MKMSFRDFQKLFREKNEGEKNMKKTLENNILFAFGQLVAFLLLMPLVLTFRAFKKLFKKAKNEKTEK